MRRLMLIAGLAASACACASTKAILSVDGHRKNGMAALAAGRHEDCIAEMTMAIYEAGSLLNAGFDPNILNWQLGFAHFGRARCFQESGKCAEAVADYEHSLRFQSQGCRGHIYKRDRQDACKASADALEGIAVCKKKLAAGGKP